MNYQEDFTLPAGLLEKNAEQGFFRIPELLRVMMNSAMRIERQKYLVVGLYEYSQERRTHPNGFKPKRSKHGWVMSPSIFHK